MQRGGLRNAGCGGRGRLGLPLSILVDGHLLTDYLREYGDERDPSEVAAIAIDAWLALAKGEVAYVPGARGYQWKGLFLPERTEVRMLSGGSYTYAQVLGDALVYGGQALTHPSLPASSVALDAMHGATCGYDFPVHGNGKKRPTIATTRTALQRKVKAGFGSTCRRIRPPLWLPA